MAKKKRQKENKNFKKIVLDVIFIAFLICIIICVYNIVKWVKDNNDTKKILNEISAAVTVDEITENENNDNKDKKYSIDFNMLKSTNSDTVGWLKVNGTDIEYPVVKTTNNDYYLLHSFDKTYNSAGWVFADYRNNIDGTDKNIIIYGHNRRDGSIFATLKNVLNQSWYENEENRQVIFVTENGQYNYQVFAVYQVDKNSYDTTVKFSSDEQFTNYIENAKRRSAYNFEVDVTSSDNILTLSTCANNNQYRVVLHAKLLSD